MANIYRKEDDTEFFPTPQKIRDDLYAMIPENVHYILDPCCGDGCLEVDNDKYDYTLFDLVDRSNGKFVVNIGDFLKQQYHPAPNGEKFDAVVMNPPFGLTEEFIRKSFEFSDDIYMIAPFRTVLKKFPFDVVDYKINWRYSYLFNNKIRVQIGILHLQKQKTFFISRKNAYEDFLRKGKLPKEKTFDSCFFQATKSPEDKWFIVNRVTMTRVERNHQLIQDNDIYAPGSEDAFIAICSNVNVKKGEKISRNIMTFNSYEEAKLFQKKYNDNDEYIRNYIYSYGENILGLSHIPLP